MDGRGFDEHTWDTLKVWSGRCATPHDVDAGAAVFALGDTLNGRPLDWMLPQPVIWYEEDEEFAAVVVQAEGHETETGETIEMLGLVLPTGQTAVAFTEDVEEVDGVDSTWVALVEAELEPDLDADDEDADDAVLADEEDEDDDGALFHAGHAEEAEVEDAGDAFREASHKGDEEVKS